MSAAEERVPDLREELRWAASEAATGPARLRGMRVVVLAGGRGTRLAPYTSVLPKPLMPVGDRSILEIVVDQLAEYGVSDVTFCVGYLSHLIQAVFENRANGHVDIEFVQEPRPLGTAAPLRLVDGLDRTFLVMNGDVLTTLDFDALVAHHRAHENVLTIATHERTITIDYGILDVDGNRVSGFEEKPTVRSAVSMGIYVMEPEVVELVPADVPFDFPELVRALLAAGRRVGSYRHDGLWYDIGRRDDYEEAVAAWHAHNGGRPADEAPSRPTAVD